MLTEFPIANYADLPGANDFSNPRFLDKFFKSKKHDPTKSSSNPELGDGGNNKRSLKHKGVAGLFHLGKKEKSSDTQQEQQNSKGDDSNHGEKRSHKPHSNHGEKSSHKRHSNNGEKSSHKRHSHHGESSSHKHHSHHDEQRNHQESSNHEKDGRHKRSSHHGGQGSHRNHRRSLPDQMSPANSRNGSSKSASTKGSEPKENPFGCLKRYNTVFLVDDSASMGIHSRWPEVGAALSSLAKTATQYDSEGIDIHFLNSVSHLKHAQSPGDVVSLFSSVQPTGASRPIDVRVDALTSLHLSELENRKSQGESSPGKPLNLAVITDGAADDPDSLLFSIASLARRLEEGNFNQNEIGIQFIQVGNEKKSTEFLKKLDEELKIHYGVKRDIVDTTPYQGKVTGDFILKTLVGGINRRIDDDNQIQK